MTLSGMKEVKKIRKQAITIAITLLFVLIFAGAASAANVTVGPDSTYNYQAIQSAVDASADSDTITVYPNGNGVYNENVIVNKLLNIVANSSDTVVNGSFTITATGSGSTIQGFTINKGTPSIVFTENFDGVSAPALPAGWAVQDVSGYQGNWATNNGLVHLNWGQPAHSTPNVIYFNSWDANYGESARLYRTSGLDLSGLSSAQLSFWMFHEATMSSNNDYIRLQLSPNGVSWSGVGPTIYRYDGSTGWKEHTIDISAFTGPGMNNVQIGILGYSTWGNDICIDDITVTTGMAPATNGIYLNGASNVKIIGNTINGFNNGNGIYAYNSNGDIITGNNINGCVNGISLYGANNNMLTGNNVLANTNIGIYLNQYSTGNTLFNNTANNNNYGIYLNYYSNNNYLVENTVANNPYDGITLGASTGNTLQRNIVTNNQRYGLWSNYYGNTIIENIIMNNNYGIGLNNYVNNGLAETINFNRIYNNTIYNLENRLTANGIPDATYNWWGTNSQTEITSKISGTANYSPWLYMTINADPNNINNRETSLITVSFNNYSTNGVTYTPLANPTLGHLPDGTPVTFNTALGSFGGSKTIETLTSGGLATATFNADETAGSAAVSAVTDAQTVNLNVVINPKSSLYLNVTTNNTNPMVGDTVLYTLKVGNQGPDTAQDVVMTYVIPQGLEFAGATVDNGTYTYDASTRTITWTIGKVPVGDPYLWLSLRVAQAGQYLINPTLTTSTYDPTLNTNTQSLTVNAQAAVEPETVNAQTETKTVGMQKTGIPVNYLVLALLLLIGGYLVPKRK